METCFIFNQYLNNALPLDVTIAGETYCDERYRIMRENSSIMALEYIISGSGTLEIEGQTLHPESGDVFFLKRGSCHTYYADPADPWHKLWIVFTGELAECFARCYLPADTYLFKNCALESVFRNMLSLTQNPQYDYPRMVSDMTALLLKVFMYIFGQSSMEHIDLAEQIRSKLDSEAELPFSLDALSHEFHYSKNYIIRIFEEKYHITPGKYHSRQKIETAKVYLCNSNFSVSEIAARLSYTDPQYFSASFKKATGYSPREYRNRFKG